MLSWLLIGLYVVLISPLRLGLILDWRQEGGFRGALGMVCWGVPAQLQFRAVRDALGVMAWETTFRGRMLPAPSGDGPAPGIIRLLRTLKRANLARRLLKRRMRLRTLSLDGVVGGADAAAAALATGFLRALAGATPLRCRLLPGFGEKSHLTARCIADVRLGTLMTACLLGLTAWGLTEKKEERPWITPSEN